MVPAGSFAATGSTIRIKSEKTGSTIAILCHITFKLNISILKFKEVLNLYGFVTSLSGFDTLISST